MNRIPLWPGTKSPNTLTAMHTLIEKDKLYQAVIPFRDFLEQIYREMDRAFDQVAAQLGFVCNGCEQNCCRSRFYHYTYLEYLYLYEGFSRLEPVQRESVRQNAVSMCWAEQSEEDQVRNNRMCPLNANNRCGLYPYRPMICRLHGIPYQLQRPGKDAVLGPGCEAFEQQRSSRSSTLLDRTPFYRQLAELEHKFKEEVVLGQKFKMTISEMILSFDGI